MSIKTSKRIALGVIASLVFAPFAAITPAQGAAHQNAAAVDALTASPVQLAALSNTGAVVRKGTAVTTLISATTGATVPVTDRKFVFKAILLSSPATSAKNNSDITLAIAGSGTMATNGGGGGIMAGAAVAGTAGGGAASIAIAPQEASGGLFTINTSGNMVQTAFTPDVAGRYQIYVWTDQNANNLRDSTEAATTVTIVAGEAPTSMKVTTVNATAVVAPAANPLLANNHGSLSTIELKDANGNLTALAAGEGIQLIPSTTTATISINNGSYSNAGATVNWVAGTNPNDKGLVTINVRDTAEGSTTLTISPAGTISTIASSQVVITYKTTNEDADDGAVTIFNTTGFTTKTAAAAVIGSSTATDASTLGSSVTLRYTQTTTAASKVVPYTVLDTSGANTSVKGARYTSYLTPSAGIASVTVKYSPVLGDTTTIAVVADTDAKSKGFTITAADPAFSQANGTMSPSNISAIPGGTVTVTAKVLDQFGSPMVGRVAAFSVAGRNPSTAVTNVLTDANGEAKFSFTDSGSTGSDSVSYTVGGTAAAGTATVTYSSTNAIGTVVLDGGDTTAGVTNAVVSVKDIGADSAGASASANRQTFSATIKNASGAVLAGVPVTWSISGTTAAVLSTTKTTFTDASGVATTSVYAWKSGQYTVTATAGTVSGTGLITFGQTTDTEARIISATVSGSTINATVVDRFGNGVNNVTVYATRTAGNGYFGNGTISTNSATNANGAVSFVVAGADADITLSLVNPTSPAGTTFGQSCAKVGFTSCAATAVALVAPTVGTATTAETNVGNDIAPAGVATVAVKVTGLTVVPEVVYEKPTLSIVQSGGRVFLSGTAENGEGDIIIYVKRVGTTAWKERAKTLEVAAPGDFNGSIKAPRGNVVIRVKQEGTGLFSNQVIIVK